MISNFPLSDTNTILLAFIIGVLPSNLASPAIEIEIEVEKDNVL